MTEKEAGRKYCPMSFAAGGPGSASRLRCQGSDCMWWKVESVGEYDADQNWVVIEHLHTGHCGAVKS